MTQATYPQHPPPPQPEPPKKKRGALKVILIIAGGVLALLVLLGSCVALISGDDTAAPPAQTTSGEPKQDGSQPPAEKTYKIGEKATDGDYQFTVTKVKCGVSRVGDSMSNEKAQGQFCLVSMRVKNVGKEPIHLSDENQALFDTKGREYSPDDAAWIYIDTDPYAEINPGNVLKTVIPFDVPKKAKPDHLLLKAGVWGASDGVVVKL